MPVVAQVEAIELLNPANDQGEVGPPGFGRGDRRHGSLEFLGYVGVPLLECRRRSVWCQVGPATGGGGLSPGLIGERAVAMQRSLGAEAELHLASTIVEEPGDIGMALDFATFGASEVGVDAKL